MHFWIERIINGNSDFLQEMKPLYIKSIIDYIRNMKDNSEIKDYNEIINQIYTRVKDIFPYFIFQIIYDMEEYKDKVDYLLRKNEVFENIDSELLKEILYNTSYGKEIVLYNLGKIIKDKDEYMTIILDYLFSDYETNLKFIENVSKNNNLHIRFLYFEYLINNGKNDLNNDILKYLFKFNEKSNEFEFMDQNDVSRLAILFLETDNKELFLRLKEFIIRNYKYNDLAELMLMNSDSNKYSLKTLENKTQADELFLTSGRYQYIIYKKYREYISDEIINSFSKYLNIFENCDDHDNKLHLMFKYELWRDLVENVDKYLSLSKDTTYNFIKSGTCSDCYRVGDFVFKLCDRKYSRDEIICPNNYLILKNLEEKFIRRDNGRVIAGFEIQNYLTRSANKIPEEIFDKYTEALLKLGYVYDDYFIDSSYGDNCMLLDSYLQADCSDPESLPEWFKEYPLVVIDRDTFIKK